MAAIIPDDHSVDWEQQERAEDASSRLLAPHFNPRATAPLYVNSDWQTIKGEPALLRAPERCIPGDLVQQALELLAFQWLIIALNQAENRLAILRAWPVVIDWVVGGRFVE